jgi:hypothetical protein
MVRRFELTLMLFIDLLGNIHGDKAQQANRRTTIEEGRGRNRTLATTAAVGTGTDIALVVQKYTF